MTYPSSKFSTVGGWISTGGVGINSFRYGRLSKQIVSLTVVTGSGEVKKLASSDRISDITFPQKGKSVSLLKQL